MSLNYNSTYLKTVDGKLAMNYTGASASGVSISGNNISVKTDGTTTITGDSGIVRKEEFVFDETNDKSNGFEVVNAASGKKVDR